MKTALCFALLTVSTSLAAGNATQLSDLVVTPEKATGQCGGAKVAIVGLTQSDASGHANIIQPSGHIAITASGKRVIVGKSEPMFLQDRTMVACVDTPKGKRLVVATFCDGRSCEPAQYLIVDPTRISSWRSVDVDPACNLRCAELALGAEVPAPLRG